MLLVSGAKYIHFEESKRKVPVFKVFFELLFCCNIFALMTQALKLGTFLHNPLALLLKASLRVHHKISGELPRIEFVVNFTEIAQENPSVWPKLSAYSLVSASKPVR